MKLYAFYVGGRMERSRIELHDIFFSIGSSVKDCHDDLRAQWWGVPDSFHIDCWGVLDHADGYDIDLRPEPGTAPEKLYFANLGGYDPAEFTELHRNIFVVAPTMSKAKVRTLATVNNWPGRHRDNLYEVENMLCLNDMLSGRGLHVHLTPASLVKPFSFTCRYIPLG